MGVQNFLSPLLPFSIVFSGGRGYYPRKPHNNFVNHICARVSEYWSTFETESAKSEIQRHQMAALQRQVQIPYIIKSESIIVISITIKTRVLDNMGITAVAIKWLYSVHTEVYSADIFRMSQSVSSNSQWLRNS